MTPRGHADDCPCPYCERDRLRARVAELEAALVSAMALGTTLKGHLATAMATADKWRDMALKLEGMLERVLKKEEA